jgi:hypothetical protein
VGGSAQVHDDCWTGLEMKVASSEGLGACGSRSDTMPGKQVTLKF